MPPEPKLDWKVYRYKVDAGYEMSLCPSTQEPWDYLDLPRVVEMELRATLHGCTRAKAESVLGTLHLD